MTFFSASREPVSAEGGEIQGDDGLFRSLLRGLSSLRRTGSGSRSDRTTDGSLPEFSFSRLREFDEALPLFGANDGTSVRLSLDRSVLLVLEPAEPLLSSWPHPGRRDTFLEGDGAGIPSPSSRPSRAADHYTRLSTIRSLARDGEVDSELAGGPQGRESVRVDPESGGETVMTSALAQAALAHAAPFQSIACYLCSVKGPRGALLESGFSDVASDPTGSASSSLDELAARCGGTVWAGPRYVSEPPYVTSKRSVRLSGATWDLLWVQIPDPREVLLRQRQEEAASAASPGNDEDIPQNRPQRGAKAHQTERYMRQLRLRGAPPFSDLRGTTPWASMAGHIGGDEEHFLKLPSVPVLITLSEASLDFFLFDRVSTADAPLVDCCYDGWCAWSPDADRGDRAAPAGAHTGQFLHPGAELTTAACACHQTSVQGTETKVSRREKGQPGDRRGARRATRPSPWLIEWDWWWWQRPRFSQDRCASSQESTRYRPFASLSTISKVEELKHPAAASGTRGPFAETEADMSLPASVCGDMSQAAPRLDLPGTDRGASRLDELRDVFSDQEAAFHLHEEVICGAGNAASATELGSDHMDARGVLSSPCSWFGPDAGNSIRRFRLPLRALLPLVTVKKRKGGKAEAEALGRAGRTSKAGKKDDTSGEQLTRPVEKVMVRREENELQSEPRGDRMPASHPWPWGGTEKDALEHGCFRLQFCSASKADELVIVWNYAVALWCTVSHCGLLVKRRFWLQRTMSFTVYEKEITESNAGNALHSTRLVRSTTRALAPVQLLSLASRNELLFALTAPPRQHLLVWSLHGVALYAITLHCYSPLSAMPVLSVSPKASRCVRLCRGSAISAGSSGCLLSGDNAVRCLENPDSEAPGGGVSVARGPRGRGMLSQRVTASGLAVETGSRDSPTDRTLSKKARGEDTSESQPSEGSWEPASNRATRQNCRQSCSRLTALDDGARGERLAGPQRRTVRSPFFLSLQVTVDCTYAVLTDSDHAIWCIDLDAYFASSPLETAAHLLASSTSMLLRRSPLSSAVPSLGDRGGGGASPETGSASLCATALGALLPPSTAAKILVPSAASTTPSPDSSRVCPGARRSCAPPQEASSRSWTAVLEERRRVAEGLAWAAQLHQASAALSAFPSAFNLLPLVVSVKRLLVPTPPVSQHDGGFRPEPDSKVFAGVTPYEDSDWRRQEGNVLNRSRDQRAWFQVQRSAEEQKLGTFEQDGSAGGVEIGCVQRLSSSPSSISAHVQGRGTLLCADHHHATGRSSPKSVSNASQLPFTATDAGCRLLPHDTRRRSSSWTVHQPAEAAQRVELPTTPSEAFDDLVAECSRVNLSVFFTRTLGAAPVVPQALWRLLDPWRGCKQPKNRDEGKTRSESMTSADVLHPFSEIHGYLADPDSPLSSGKERDLCAHVPVSGKRSTHEESLEGQLFRELPERLATGAPEGAGGICDESPRRSSTYARGTAPLEESERHRYPHVHRPPEGTCGGTHPIESGGDAATDFCLFTTSSRSYWYLSSGPDDSPAIVLFATPAELQVEMLLVRNEARRLDRQRLMASRVASSVPDGGLGGTMSRFQHSQGDAEAGSGALALRPGQTPSPVPSVHLADLLALSLLRCSRAVCAPRGHQRHRLRRRRESLCQPPDVQHGGSSHMSSPVTSSNGQRSCSSSPALALPFVSATAPSFSLQRDLSESASLIRIPQACLPAPGGSGHGLGQEPENSVRPRRRWFDRPKPEELLELSLSFGSSRASATSLQRSSRHQRMLLSHLQSGGNAVLLLGAPTPPGSCTTAPGPLYGVGRGAPSFDDISLVGSGSGRGCPEGGLERYLHQGGAFGGRLPGDLDEGRDTSLAADGTADDDDDSILDQLLLSSPAQFFCSNLSAGGAPRGGGLPGWGSDASVMLLELDALMDRSSGGLMKMRMRQDPHGLQDMHDLYASGRVSVPEGGGLWTDPGGFSGRVSSHGVLLGGGESAAVEDLLSLLSAALPPGAQEQLLPLLLPTAADFEHGADIAYRQASSWHTTNGAFETAPSGDDEEALRAGTGSVQAAGGCCACAGPVMLPSWLTGARMPVSCSCCAQCDTAWACGSGFKAGDSVADATETEGGNVSPIVRPGVSLQRPSFSSVTSRDSGCSPCSSDSDLSVASVAAGSGPSGLDVGWSFAAGQGGAPPAPRGHLKRPCHGCRTLVPPSLLEEGFPGGVALLTAQEARRQGARRFRAPPTGLRWRLRRCSSRSDSPDSSCPASAGRPRGPAGYPRAVAALQSGAIGPQCVPGHPRRHTAPGPERLLDPSGDCGTQGESDELSVGFSDASGDSQKIDANGVESWSECAGVAATESEEFTREFNGCPRTRRGCAGVRREGQPEVTVEARRRRSPRTDASGRRSGWHGSASEAHGHECHVSRMQVHLCLHYIAVEVNYSCACRGNPSQKGGKPGRGGDSGWRLGMPPCRHDESPVFLSSLCCPSLSPPSPSSPSPSAHLLWLLRWPHTSETEDDLSATFASFAGGSDAGGRKGGCTISPLWMYSASGSPAFSSSSTFGRRVNADPKTHTSQSLRWHLFASHALSPWKGLSVNDQAFYIISPSSLFALSPSLRPLSVLLNVAIFEGVTAAAAFCVVNGVELKCLCHLLLFVGLKYRKLDMVKSALGLLPEAQQMAGIRMLILYILRGYSSERLVVPVHLPPSPQASRSACRSGPPEAERRKKKGRREESTTPASGLNTPRNMPQRSADATRSETCEQVEVLDLPGDAAPEVDYYTAAAPGIYSTVLYLLHLFHFPIQERHAPPAFSPPPASLLPRPLGTQGRAQSPGQATLDPRGDGQHFDHQGEGPDLENKLAVSRTPLPLPFCASPFRPYNGDASRAPASSGVFQHCRETLRLLDGWSLDDVEGDRGLWRHGQAHARSMRNAFPPPAICILPPHPLVYPREGNGGGRLRSLLCASRRSSFSFDPSHADAVERARAAAARATTACVTSWSRGMAVPFQGSLASQLASGSPGSAGAGLSLGSQPAVPSAMLLFGTCSRCDPRLLSSLEPEARADSRPDLNPAGASWTGRVVSGGGSQPVGSASFASALQGSSASGSAGGEAKCQESLLAEAAVAAAAAAAASSLLAVDKAFCSRLLAILLQFANALIGRRVLRKIQICDEWWKGVHSGNRPESRSSAPPSPAWSSRSSHTSSSRSCAPISCTVGGPEKRSDTATVRGAQRRAQQQVTDELLELTVYLQFIRALQQALMLSLPSAKVYHLSAASLHHVRTEQQKALQLPLSASQGSHAAAPVTRSRSGALAPSAASGLSPGDAEADQRSEKGRQEDQAARRSNEKSPRRDERAWDHNERRETRSVGRRVADLPYPSEWVHEEARPASSQGEREECDNGSGEDGSTRGVSEKLNALPAPSRESCAPPSASVEANQGHPQEHPESSSPPVISSRSMRQKQTDAAAAAASVTCSTQENLWPDDADTESVIRDALLTGRVSSALVWLERRRTTIKQQTPPAVHAASEERARSASTAQVTNLPRGRKSSAGRDASTSRALWGEAGDAEEAEETAMATVQRVGRRMVFQLFCNQQVEFFFVGMQMLRQLGINVPAFCSAVAFFTTRPLVRRRLLRHLRHMGRLSQARLKLIDFLQVLEQEFTNPCYTAEYNRQMTLALTQQQPVHIIDALPPLPARSSSLSCKSRDASASELLRSSSQTLGHQVESGSHPAQNRQGDETWSELSGGRSGPASPDGRARWLQLSAAPPRHGIWELAAEGDGGPALPLLSGRIAGTAVWPPGGLLALWMSVECAGMVGEETREMLLARLAPCFFREAGETTRDAREGRQGEKARTVVYVNSQGEDVIRGIGGISGREGEEVCGDRVVCAHSLSDEDEDYTLLSVYANGPVAFAPSPLEQARGQPISGATAGGSQTTPERIPTAALVSHYSNEAVTAWAHLQVGDVDDLSSVRLFGIPAFPHNLHTSTTGGPSEGLDSHTAAAAAALNETFSSAYELDGGDGGVPSERQTRQETSARAEGRSRAAGGDNKQRLVASSDRGQEGGRRRRARAGSGEECFSSEGQETTERQSRDRTSSARASLSPSAERGRRRREEPSGPGRETNAAEDESGEHGEGESEEAFTERRQRGQNSAEAENAPVRSAKGKRPTDRRHEDSLGSATGRGRDTGSVEEDAERQRLAEAMRLMKMRGICWECRRADVKDLDFSFSRASTRTPWRGLRHRQDGRAAIHGRGSALLCIRGDERPTEIAEPSWFASGAGAGLEAEGSKQSGTLGSGGKEDGEVLARQSESSLLRSPSSPGSWTASFLDALELRLPKKSILSGYLCVTLDWVYRWSRGASLRILLERRHISLLDDLRAEGQRGERARQKERERARRGAASGHCARISREKTNPDQEVKEQKPSLWSCPGRRLEKRDRERRDRGLGGPEALSKSRHCPRRASPVRSRTGADRKTVTSVIASSLNLHGNSLGLWWHTLMYFVSHHDWRGVSLWVRRLPLEGLSVNSYGVCGPQETAPELSRPHTHLVPRLLSRLTRRCLNACSPFLRDVLLQELAMRGILCESSGDSRGFPLLLRRLAKAGLLFSLAIAGAEPEADGHEDDKEKRPGEREASILSLTKAFVPVRQVSPFHCYLLLLFIVNDVPSLLSAYLQVYRLGCTYAAVHELKEALSQSAASLIQDRIRSGPSSPASSSTVSSSGKERGQGAETDGKGSPRQADRPEKTNSTGAREESEPSGTQERKERKDSRDTGTPRQCWSVVGGSGSAYWRTVLLLGRLGNNALFATALHQAAWLLLEEERLASPSPPEDTGETSRGTGEDEAGRRTASEALVGMPCTGREGDVCGAWRANRVRKGAPYFSIRRLVTYDSDNVGFVALNSLACVGRPLLFLATLMLLPLSSALEAMEADKALPWHLEEQTLRSTLEAFPELFAAYYPDEAQPGEGSLTSPLGRKGLSSLEPHGETRSVFCAGLRTQKEESESLHIQEGRPLPTRLPLPLFEVVLRQQHRQRMEGARCHHRGERTCKALGGPACLQDIEGESEPATCARAEDERINREQKEALHSPEKSYGPRDFFVCPHGSNHEEEDLDSLLPDCIVSLDADCVADSSPRTWRGDVSLLAMLSDVTGLDASALLRPLPLFRRLFELQRARMRRQRLSALLNSRRLASGASAETDPEEKSRDHMKEVKEDAEGERVLLAWLRSGEAFSAIKGDALGVSRGSQEAEKESQGSLVTSTPALSNRHPASATCTAEGLSVAYYIAQGRPAMAFHLLFALRAASSLPFSSSFSEAGPTVEDALAGWTKQAADRVCLNLSEAEQEALYDVALTVALYNMLNDGVVAAALCFLELCGLETERVRVDALSARQIYLHRKGIHAHTSTAPNAPFSRRSTKKKGAEVEAGDAGEVTVTAADSLSADGGRARETGDTPRGGASAQATGLEGSGFEGDETEDEAEEDAWFPEMAEEDIVPDEEAASVIDLFLSFPKPTKRPTTTTGAQTGEDDDGFGSQDEGGQEEQGARKPRQRDDKKADTKLCKDENEEEESSAGISSPHLLAALRMLEEATWSLDPNLATTQAAAATPLSLDSPWHLVGLFCRVHQLPRSLTLLHELARNDEWLLFLHEGDLQQCPVQTMTNIIDGYFRDAPLRHHLRIVVRSVERPPLSLSPPASRVLPFSCSFDEADADGEDAVSFPDLIESESPSKPFLVPESWTVDSSPLSLVERQAAPTVEERPQPETGLSPLEERNGDPRRGDGNGKEQADPTEASGLTSAHLVPRTEPRNDTGPPCPGSGIRLPNADVSDVMSLLLKSRVASPALGLGSPQDVPGLAEARAQQPLASVSPLSSPSPPLSTDLQGVGTQLLLHALKVCCPRLSVYAACFADASSLVCVNTWLYLQTQTLLLSSRFPGDRERRAKPSSAGGDAAPGRYASYESGGARRSRRKRGEEGDGRRRRRTLERAQLGELELGARIEHDPNREHPEASLLELTLLGLSAVTSWRGESGRGRKRSREREEDLSSDADAAEETEGTTRSCGPGRRRRDADGGRKAKKRGEEVVCGDLFLGDSGEGDKEGARESAGRLTPPAFFPSSTEGEEEALLLWLSDPRHTVRLVLWLCEEGMYSLVIRAFRLFDESNVLLDILLFFR
ncbi:hypothetical protein TGARI_224870A [Toxoplasma gondii ARI]|uniref:Spatacsin C-terminal domain-containing protein n=1 Tax=Toxoplasma gondii ARI TaxID=1074872 RepID=A0A139XTK5_TOXGO|nr:hypothetical protein TGARI_224870A [Toxoplasma gondii ARI]